MSTSTTQVKALLLKKYMTIEFLQCYQHLGKKYKQTKDDFRDTVPGKCKLTVPRNSNNSTRSSILETRKLRGSSLESRTSSFESRTSSFESRTSSFETGNKELSASLTFHATISATFSVSEKRVKGRHFIPIGPCIER